MKAHDIRQLELHEVRAKLSEKLEELANLKFQHALHQLDNSIKLRTVRREVARLMTLLREHELGVRRLNEGTSRAGSR